MAMNSEERRRFHEAGWGPIIQTRKDLADALTSEFLANADNGENEANDDLIKSILDWQRGED